MTADLVLRGLVYGTGIVAVGVCLFYGLWRFLALALVAAWRAFGPRGPGAADDRIPRTRAASRPGARTGPGRCGRTPGTPCCTPRARSGTC